MRVEEILYICRAYASLGSAVQDQLVAICDDASTVSDQNPNALRMIDEWFFSRILYTCTLNPEMRELADETRDLRNLCRQSCGLSPLSPNASPEPAQQFACLECGKRLSLSAAQHAVNEGCPKCGGSDIDLA